MLRTCPSQTSKVRYISFLTLFCVFPNFPNLFTLLIFELRGVTAWYSVSLPRYLWFAEAGSKDSFLISTMSTFFHSLFLRVNILNCCLNDLAKLLFVSSSFSLPIWSFSPCLYTPFWKCQRNFHTLYTDTIYPVTCWKDLIPILRITQATADILSRIPPANDTEKSPVSNSQRCLNTDKST